jgi:hypothetical protein
MKRNELPDDNIIFKATFMFGDAFYDIPAMKIVEGEIYQRRFFGKGFVQRGLSIKNIISFRVIQTSTKED